jgi:tetratricopeptide (TPR) repeat protein
VSVPDEENNPAELPGDSPVGVESDYADGSMLSDSGYSDPVAVLKAGWRDAWQIPAMLVGGGMLFLGVAYSIATAPDPDMTPAIVEANLLIENEEYEQAIELLNTKVYPWVEKPEFPADDRVLYHLAKARSIFRGQKKMRLNDERNHFSVIREYLEAERLGETLGPRDLASLANTYISLDKFDLALQRARDIPESQRYLRDSVEKQAVDSMLDRVLPETDRAMDLLADILFDPNLPVNERVWAIETQGQVRLAQGFADETITRILREMPRLERAGAEGRSRLHLMLSKAYTQVGALKQAGEQVEHAMVLSANGDQHYPQILLMQAIVEDSKGNTIVARDLYGEITANYSNSSAYPLALLGLGETEAALEEPSLAIEAYESLVDQYGSFGIESYPSRQQVLDSLLSRSSDSLSAGMPGDSIRFANIADRLYRNTETPTEVLYALAIAHQSAAEVILRKPISEVRTLLGLDPSTRAEVQRHLISSATNFNMHAERHVVSNLATYASSLWSSADLFDRAGDQPEAILAFKTYSESMPSDPKNAEAQFRLAESLRALGDFKTAADVYNGLIDAREGSGGADIGPFADASHVPLAQAYLYDEDPANDVEAEKLLASSLDGTMGSTETALFRDALLELGGLYDRTDRPERAIERYDEFVARYPDDSEAGTIQFKLGDAHRRLADTIGKSLEEAMPAAERNRRLAVINDHRTNAIEFYQQSISTLESKPSHQLGLFESIALRNSYFYLGDCAFDLGNHDQAIAYYDRARDKYISDPSSLVAMVQIVNSYIATDRMGRARTANERAKRFYETMPADVWDDPNLPMDRTDWERWLNSSALIFANATP